MTVEQSPDCGCNDPPPDPEQGAKVRVLLIDDDEDDQFLTAERLADVPGRPYVLTVVSRYEAGLEALCNGTHDAYLLDFRLGARTGIELLREAQGRGCSGPVILLTGQGELQTDLAALDAGAADYLEKSGLTSHQLDRSLRYALAQHRAEEQLERKVAERTEELGRANQALREADRRKDEFLATLAHELRNPLVPIRNALEILRLSSDSSEAVLRQRERIERQVLHLQRLVEDLLDVSRITLGKLRLNLERLNLLEVLEMAMEASRPLVERAGLSLDFVPLADPIPIQGDRLRLTQVFTNLLNNASKFTEPGGRVTVSVELTAAAVMVSVQDTGVGIPAELLPGLFNPFTQIDQTLNRSQGGLGIGLALVRRVTEIHGGNVAASSPGIGQGSTFTVTLPIYRSGGAGSRATSS